MYIARLQAHSKAYSFGPIMEWSQKIRNFSLSSKIFGHCYQGPNFPWFQRCYRKFNPTLLQWPTGFFFFKWSWKIRNLSLLRIIFEHCHLVQNFPPFPERSYRKFNPTFLHWATAFFFFKWSQKIHNFGLYRQIFEHFKIIHNFPPSSRKDKANSIRPFSIGLLDFFQKWFSGFLKKVSPGYLRAHFLNRNNNNNIFA